MKNIKNIKLNIIILLSVLAIACFMSFFFTQNNGLNYVLADKVTISQGVFSDEYNLNSEVDFPSEIQVEYKGKTYTASNGIVFYPNGKAVYATWLRLDQLGDYAVRYYFDDDNGDKCIAEKTFVVTNKLYSVSTTNGSVVAVSKEQQENAEYLGNDVDVTFHKEDALIVRLAEGDTFNFTKSIDLSQVGEDGLCDLITLDYRNVNFVPNELYNPNDQTNSWKKLKVQSNIATYCIIRLSDSYDLGNYVELYCRLACPDNNSVDINSSSVGNSQKSNYYPSFTVCAVGQKRTAITAPVSKEYATYYNVTIDGEKYGLYYNNEKGGRTFSGFPLVNDHSAFTWKYDFNSNKVYIQHGTQSVLVGALSSSEVYGTNTFPGFSSGKVKLSVFMSDYVSGDKGRIDINSIGGYDGKELVENFGKLGFIDDVALPVINLDVIDTDERGIYVPLGSDYVLPTPNVVSNEAIVSSTVNVYANYGTPAQLDVAVVDGKIKIDKDRQYTAVYVVKNSAGCVGYYTLTINPVQTEKPITLNTSYAGLNTVEAGARVILPEFSLETINKQSALKVAIKAVHNNETINIDPEKRTFIPKYAGEYTIVYDCSDNVYDSVIYKYAIQSQTSNNVSFVGKFNLPRYFIKNAEYSLEAVPCFAYDKATPSPVDFSAFISYDNGQTFLPIEDYRCVEITGSNTAIIKYTCQKGNSSDQIISEPITIVDVGYGGRLAVRDYFIHDEFEAKSYSESKKTAVQYDLIAPNTNGTLKFVNAIDFSSLEFGLKIPVDRAYYERADVILTDYYDENVSYTISFIDKGGVCYVSLNGERTLASDFPFASNSNVKEIEYDVLTKIFTINDLEFSVDLSSMFTSSLCYIDVKVVNAYGDASIIIDKINGQTIRNNKYNDTQAPLISIKDFSGEYERGSVITILPPCVTDVYSTIINQNVTIKVTKDGKVLSSVDGVKLDNANAMRSYQVKLDSYGKYMVVITAFDGSDNDGDITCILSVVDSVAPTIKLNVDQNVNIKKGSTFTLKYSVSDDITAGKDIAVTIFLRDIKVNAFYTYNTNAIRFNRVGSYQVYIYAKDEAGNFAYKLVNVTVEE
ncbi:MAG: hypothetical protein E7347_00590 [Clostridiales bacterium]|nr:hypothetical protein [Clostridiales bacterium]